MIRDMFGDVPKMSIELRPYLLFPDSMREGDATGLCARKSGTVYTASSISTVGRRALLLVSCGKITGQVEGDTFGW